MLSVLTTPVSNRIQRPTGPFISPQTEVFSAGPDLSSTVSLSPQARETRLLPAKTHEEVTLVPLLLSPPGVSPNENCSPKGPGYGAGPLTQFEPAVEIEHQASLDGVLSRLAPTPKPEDRFHFRVETPTLNFDSARAAQGLRSLGLLSAPGVQSEIKTRPATDAQVALVAKAIGNLPTRAFPEIKKWLAFEHDSATPEQAAHKIAGLVGDAIARPDEVAGPLAPFLPRLKPGIFTGSMFLKAARFVGIDFGLHKKGERAARDLEPELKDFIEAFEEALPICIGQLVTAKNMAQAQGQELDYREFVPRLKAAEVMGFFGLSVTEQQASSVNQELDKAYTGLFTEVGSFMEKRGKPSYESFSGLVDAIADDLSVATSYLGQVLKEVKRG